MKLQDEKLIGNQQINFIAYITGASRRQRKRQNKQETFFFAEKIGCFIKIKQKMRKFSELGENLLDREGWFSQPFAVSTKQFKTYLVYQDEQEVQKKTGPAQLESPASTTFYPNSEEIYDLASSRNKIEEFMGHSDTTSPKLPNQTTIKQPQDERQNKFNKQGETKNIVKNFGKQSIKFVRQNKDTIKKLLSIIGSLQSYEQLLRNLDKKRNKIRKIQHLRELWLPSQRYGREMRVICNYFLRTHAYQWIFNSRVKDYCSHIKYKKVLAQQLKNPQKFLCLKSNF